MTQEPVEPFAVGRLDVGDGHVLYYEQVGRPDGTPVVYLHGGPGSGCTPGARRHFDPQRHRAVLFDQRAAGRSTPHAADEGVHWASIDMDHHVADIERLREHLGIDRWIVFGISWGSVLGATYAERHPDRVIAVVLAAVSTGHRRGHRLAHGPRRSLLPGRVAGLPRPRASPSCGACGSSMPTATSLMDPDPAIREAGGGGVVPVGGRPRGHDAGRGTRTPATKTRGSGSGSPAR